MTNNNEPTNAQLLVSVCYTLKALENRGIMNPSELKAYAGMQEAFHAICDLTTDEFMARIRDSAEENGKVEA